MGGEVEKQSGKKILYYSYEPYAREPPPPSENHSRPYD